MAITTYDELVAALGNWLERDDLTDRAPDFIGLAEAQMNRLFRLRQMEKRATAVLTSTDVFFTIPLLPNGQPDFLLEKSVSLSDGTCSWELNPLPEEVIQSAPLLTGPPMHYSLVGDSIHVYPTPDATYTATLVYYAPLPALGPTNQTNWLLTKAPDAYLYGALTHAAPFLEDDTGSSATFGQLFTVAINSLKAERRTKVGVLRTDIPRAPDQRSFNIYRGGF